MSIGLTSHVGRWRTVTTLVVAIAAALSVDITPARAQGQMTGSLAAAANIRND